MISAQFQQGGIKPEQYHAAFLQLFGRDHSARTLYAELVALLPDPAKQRALAQFV